jgi:tripartite-type tricarboxylate transporter receptor subunit TctC
MILPRRQFLHLAAGAAALPAFSRVATAQTYPTRPITLIVPFAAGGPTDVIARIAAEHMSRTFGQRLVVENIAGAGGTTASARGMRASPDGYTIQIGHLGTHATAPLFYPDFAYRPDVDFAPVGMVSLNAWLIAANKNLPPKDLNEFITFAKANHQRLNMGHAGVGSNSHLTGLLLNAILGLKPVMVPFNSGAAAMNAMVAGHVDYMSAPIADGVPQVQGGTIKVFAIASPERNPALPEVPTSREAGLGEFQVASWTGMFAPKDTPKPILDKLSDVLDQALDDETTRRRYSISAAMFPPRRDAARRRSLRWSRARLPAGRQSLRRQASRASDRVAGRCMISRSANRSIDDAPTRRSIALSNLGQILFYFCQRLHDFTHVLDEKPRERAQRAVLQSHDCERELVRWQFNRQRFEQWCFSLKPERRFGTYRQKAPGSEKSNSHMERADRHRGPRRLQAAGLKGVDEGRPQRTIGFGHHP